ncbi:MAG: MFS transporter [Alphaproteobacteria bacterium]|nr:MFS transporter [Alphaproteobacteria bacterium]MBV9418604.1 MFS transporter [Alphaproteobacteria bacterium]
MSSDNKAAPSVGGVSRHYILVMLTLVYVVNYLDRNILNQLLPSIKKEFLLSDADLGFLSGTVFAILYATLGVPLAWIADRFNRRNVIAYSMILFSAMTVVSGWVSSFSQLVLARIGTGVGEAGTSPSVNSIISDLYEPKERAAALSFYATGLNIGLLIAFAGGGFVEQHFGWRIAFLAAGIPGLIVALLFIFTVPEPKRGHVEQLTDTGTAPGLFASAAYLWQRRTIRYIALGCAMSAFGGYAGSTFVATFLRTSHGLDAQTTGWIVAVLFGIVGGAGTYFSGVFADKLGARDVRWNMWLIVLVIMLALPFFPFYFLSPNLAITLLCGIPPTLIGAAYLAPSYAMVQSLVPLRMRTQAAAFLLFILNIIGFGLGPLSVGFESDLLKAHFGADSLRWALLSTVATWMLAAFCFWMASRSLKGELAAVQAPRAETQTEVAV